MNTHIQYFFGNEVQNLSSVCEDILWTTLLALLFFIHMLPKAQTIVNEDTYIMYRSSQKDYMAILPEVLLEKISDQLSIVDALAWSQTSCTIMSIIHDSCKKRVVKQHKTVIWHFPIHIIESVPMTVWFEIEWIDFNPKWIGNTNYIDNIKYSDILGGPFKCCYDTYGRLALIFRRQKNVAVLFQRYRYNHEDWVFASETLPIGGCRLSESMVAHLAIFLSVKEAD